MVRRGEYLERAVVVPGEPPLSGLYHRGRKSLGVLILPPGPDGGGMEVPAVAELAWALTRAEHPTLRLDFPGVGASGGAFSLESAESAARRGLEHLEACLLDGAPAGPAPPVGLAGVGLGAALVARLLSDRPDVDRFLVQPDPEVLGAGPPAAALGGEVVVVAAAEDPPGRVAAAKEWVAGAARGRFMLVPGADPAWRRHLVVVGRAAGELFSPPGMLELS